MKKVDLDQTFGSKEVESVEREKLIRRVFNKVAPRYDLMNDAMSFGIHRLWKTKLARFAKPQAKQTILDLAGGTGDIAIKLADPNRTVFIADPSIEMMQEGKKSHTLQVANVAAIGEKLPFADASIDKLTISFGIRNMTSMSAALKEIYRVLKPGGEYYCLEFSRPVMPVRPFYYLYNQLIVL